MAKKDMGGGSLAAQPTGVKVAMLVGVLGVLGFLYWQFVYSGLREERNAEKSKNASLIKKNGELKDQKKKYDDLVRRRPELEARTAKSLRRLPLEAELPAFLNDLQSQAGAAGVKIKTATPGPEVLIGKNAKVPYKVEAVGTFYQLSKYFWLLWKSAETGRIVTIENLHLHDPRPSIDGIELTAEFVAATFRQADAAAAAPAGKGKDAKPDAGKSDKQKVEDAKKGHASAVDKAGEP